MKKVLAPHYIHSTLFPEEKKKKKSPWNIWNIPKVQQEVASSDFPKDYGKKKSKLSNFCLFVYNDIAILTNEVIITTLLHKLQTVK